ncbi:MAG: hypothetical protein QF619_12410, partial [Candidatus Binatia bacterium]|nr:hypothetical protein [Candidatus Binatia bacterium]
MIKRYHYSLWDGHQDPFQLNPEDLLNELADDLMRHGNLKSAMRNLMQRGIRGPIGSGFEGIRELLQRLREQSQQRLERYSLSSVIDDLNRRLEEILRKERSTLQERQGEGKEEGSSNKEAQEKLEHLDQLPQGFAGKVQGLQNYEFDNEEAGKAFQELMDSLKQQALGSYFKDLAQRI